MTPPRWALRSRCRLGRYADSLTRTLVVTDLFRFHTSYRRNPRVSERTPSAAHQRLFTCARRPFARWSALDRVPDVPDLAAASARDGRQGHHTPSPRATRRTRTPRLTTHRGVRRSTSALPGRRSSSRGRPDFGAVARSAGRRPARRQCATRQTSACVSDSAHSRADLLAGGLTQRLLSSRRPLDDSSSGRFPYATEYRTADPRD
jgi:hypothetical protein